MRTLTKTLIGAGLTAATLTMLATPATADTPTDTPTPRLEGAFVMKTGSGNYYVNIPDLDDHIGVTASLPDAIAASMTVSIPAIDTTGPIVNEEGKCLDVRSGDDSKAYWAVCHSDDVQQTFNPLATGVVRWMADPDQNLDVIDTKHTPDSARLRVATQDETGGIEYVETLEFSAFSSVEAVGASVKMTAPASDAVVTDTRPVFTGTGEPGMGVRVRDKDGNELCATKVDSNGDWSCQPAKDLPVGAYEITAEQTDTNGYTTTDTVDFAIADQNPAGPVANPMIAGGAGVLAATLIGATLIRRKRTTQA